ncbi:MAG: LppY/LpqO family protein [Phycisphaerales bacterium]|nr:LppY/LpqO family protein [Phycisphaerales bacterium]
MNLTWRCIVSLSVLWMGCSAIPAAGAAQLDTAKIEQLAGAKGKMDEKEGVFKVSMPRADLNVSAGGVKITPAMGLTCWAAFMKMGDHAMVMGDQVLTEDQVNPVMSVALESGLDVTALHNHFTGDQPRIMFMHIGGMGDETKLAEAVGKVFAKIKETSGGKGELLKADIDPPSSSLDPRKVDEVIGQKGEMTKGVYKVTIGRTTRMMGQEVGNAMGVNTWAAFTGSDDKAVLDGDFAMTEQELQGVLKALRAARIQVVAIHNHMTGESPRIMFLHFWGVGPTVDLARGIRAALDTQK